MCLSGGSLAAAGALAGCLGGEIDTEPVHIGALLPLSASGFLKTVADHHQRAIEQAVTDINDAGGPLGRELKLTVEDTALDPEVAKTAFTSLVDSGVVGLVGPVVTDISMAITDQLAEKEVIGVSPIEHAPGARVHGGRERRDEVLRSDRRKRHSASARDGEDTQQRPIRGGRNRAGHRPRGQQLRRGIGEDNRREDAIGTTVETIPFPTGRDKYSGRVNRVVRSDADAVAFVTEPGNVKILQRLAGSSFDGDFVLSEGVIPAESRRTWRECTARRWQPNRPRGPSNSDRNSTTSRPCALHAARLRRDAPAGTRDTTGRYCDGDRHQQEPLFRVGGTGQTVSVDEFGRAETLIDADRTMNYQGRRVRSI